MRVAHDMATRERLIEAATDQFAEHGFRRASVRDICRDARANLAAVNYHFGGKLGLYREVVTRAVDAMREGMRAIMVQDRRIPAADRLRQYVRAFLPLIAGGDPRVASPRAQWIHKLMRHESSEPTPLALWIVQQALMPRLRYLAGIVAGLMHVPEDDPVVMRCVTGIQSQCMAYAPNKFREIALGDGLLTAAELAASAEHIVEFSLAGIRRIAELRQVSR